MPTPFEFAIELYGSAKHFRLFLHFDRGDNLLHIAAKLATLEQLEQTIAFVGRDCCALSKVYNLDKQLPIDIAACSSRLLEEKKIICRLIDSLMIDTSFVPFNPPRSFEEIINDNNHFLVNNTYLLRLLQYGYLAYEKSHKIIKFCSISSESNFIDYSLYKKINDICLAMRNDYNDKIEATYEPMQQLDDEHDENTIEDNNSNKDLDTYDDLTAIVDSVIKFQAGLCFEYACMHLHLLLHLNIKELLTHNVSIELFKVKTIIDLGKLVCINANHSIAVLGRDLTSDPNDYTTWKNTVIIDNNDVYVSELIPQKLRLYSAIPTHENAGIVSLPFNPDVHQIELDKTLNFSHQFVHRFLRDQLSLIQKKENLMFFNPSSNQNADADLALANRDLLKPR